ncbi:hypothetical protein, partial [Bacteroides uniformis]
LTKKCMAISDFIRLRKLGSFLFYETAKIHNNAGACTIKSRKNIRFLYPDTSLEGIHHFYFAS